MKAKQWKTDMDAVTQAFIENSQSLTETELNWKPSADVWSIAQNMQHLIIINSTYFPVIQQVRNGEYTLPAHGGWGWLVRWFGRVVLKSILPENRKKMKTFKIWEPSQSNLPGSIVKAFENHQIEMKAFIDSCADLIARGTVISSPANRSIVYTLETAFDIMVAHEKRHLLQALAVNKLRVENPNKNK